MQVLREDAVAIFEALGYKTSRRWSKSRMREILVELPVVKEALPGIGDERLAGVFDGMLAVVGGGGEVEFVKGTPLAVEGKASEPALEVVPGRALDKDETEAATEAADAVRAAGEEFIDSVDQTGDRDEQAGSDAEADGRDAVPDGSGQKDEFGNRKDTKAAKFCACLSEEPKSMKELMEESGLKQQYGLVNRLCKEGSVGNDKGKYWAV